MEWLEDSKACLDIARTMLDEVQELIQKSIQNKDKLPYLKVKIKNCLENCRSPLDYAANYIFDTYCRMRYSDKELKGRKGKPYFPVINEEQGKDEFDKNIKVYYKGLIEVNQEIVNILENCQPFKTNQWLKQLNFLINENKHRNLTKQRISSTTQVRQIQVAGINFSNLTLKDNVTDMAVNGQPINFRDFKPNPLITDLDATVTIDLVFKDLNLPVLPTLTDIYEGAYSVIYELDKSIERD